MKTGMLTGRRTLVAGLFAAAVPAAAVALMAGPPATGANDPCAASEIARTIGSVSKSMGDYLDSHPETNHAMTTVLQQQAGPDSVTGLKSYFEGNPRVAADVAGIAQPLTNLSMQCKLPISIPQAMGMMQQAQGAGGVPALPVSPAAGQGTAPAPGAGGALPGPSRPNKVG
ncbi:MAG: hemophore [Actinomycetota bacterium]|uniref:Hemophore n=1 Tax=Mycobacterium lentiflavum TaxID=141349 RepID=A0ABY3UVQ6_MYCLN|nr:hemophore [Mycobacterium lentiflavum]MEE3065894.1 hemophore [Actinomycetota bacterium]ULP42832.1 hemophore [Mycobacterium lentiflavum]